MGKSYFSVTDSVLNEHRGERDTNNLERLMRELKLTYPDYEHIRVWRYKK